MTTLIVNMPLKFHAHLAQRSDQPCPCQTQFRPQAVTAFRFVCNTATEDDFLPPAAKTPKPSDKCESYALSFFNSLDHARRKFLTLEKRMQGNTTRRYGDHIGRIDLVEGDGLLSDPNSSGHMDLHQNENVEFSRRIEEYFPTRVEANEGGQNAT